jgi:O-antigen chain-terminating methyltransferase
MSNDDHGGFDYLSFFNRFRSPPDELKKHQSIFVEYYAGCRDVLDIGCGRGEFLELLRERGIGGRGVDTDPEMVGICKSHGLDVAQIDAVEYLEGLSPGSIDGVFMDDIIEHLETDYMLRLVSLIGSRLTEDSYYIVKTISPLSLATFTDYYLDVTHVRALHPGALKYIVETAAPFVAELGLGCAGADLAFGVAMPGLCAIQIVGFFGAGRQDIDGGLDGGILQLAFVARGRG